MIEVLSAGYKQSLQNLLLEQSDNLFIRSNRGNRLVDSTAKLNEVRSGLELIELETDLGGFRLGYLCNPWLAGRLRRLTILDASASFQGLADQPWIDFVTLRNQLSDNLRLSEAGVLCGKISHQLGNAR